MRQFTADFETTTKLDDCRVWAWAVCDIDNPKYIEIGNSMESFFQYVKKTGGIYYFHNLKFDGEFILGYILKEGFELNKDGRSLEKNQFNTLISDRNNLFYSIRVCFETFPKNNQVEFRDSLKLLNYTVEKIAKTFKLPDQKLEIDYTTERPVGWEITEKERQYITNDVVIVAKALKILFDQDMKKLTIGSNALSDYKTRLGKKNFERIFPVFDIALHEDIKQAYKGGFTYLAPRYAQRMLGEGIVLDVNSLYPWAMHSPNLLPFGTPVFFEGEYKYDKLHPVYIQRIRCQFELKKDRIPTIQIKNNLSCFVSTEYLESSNGEDVVLTLTNVDLALIKDQYNLYELEYICGWKFRAKSGLFDNYIDHWIEIKIQATKDKNPGMRELAKLMLNSLYGKFSTSPLVRSKWPYLRDDGSVGYIVGEDEYRDPVYMPVGAFITSIARNKTIRSAQASYERFVYADTDSMHLQGLDYPEGLDISDTELGAWAHEGTFSKAMYLRSKCYLEEMILDADSKDFQGLRALAPQLAYVCDGVGYAGKITCAGMPKNLYPQVTWENFKIGTEFTGKLAPKHVDGGIVFVNSPFKIRKG